VRGLLGVEDTGAGFTLQTQNWVRRTQVRASRIIAGWTGVKTSVGMAFSHHLNIQTQNPIITFCQSIHLKYRCAEIYT
jgi:hypothetical protein